MPLATEDPALPPVTSGSWYRPSVTTTWQWQLVGAINTAYDVDLYDIDLFNVPDNVVDGLHAAGQRVVCYFSAGTYEPFRPDASGFPVVTRGKALADFPDELWLDIRAPEVLTVVRARLDRAAARGCDGVEPDNMDGYANDTGFPLTPDDQLRFNRTVANEARMRGLAVGLKNDLDQITGLVRYFDFAVNEQCHEFDECDLLTPFVSAGKPVFNAEYLERFRTDGGARAAMCQETLRLGLHTLVLPVDLDDAFRFSCD